MKKIFALTLIVVFAASVAVSFADEHKPMSKSSDDSMFQAASEHIANWGKSNQIVKEQSLRADKKEYVSRKESEPGQCRMFTKP